ncbi:hypothetical protein P9E76_00425 [Schinkia azotoformans]|uniref:Uncharacterized protein n=1 Tax=Schinkia azotoformans LMG 9581 TaxID=1131731 RepID=K6CGW9_SCHAZ|nr:hypothetical protein [Schinkia azotoformans]EKN70400.1 hypothetical protein BAZO_01332 [Schinkia azotoformans LMG 9581]MEC1640113.1 hypothetical protein [Schinkia azotoformans]MEC1943551.1 hypothetical protein [Schinkia azotoformans]
MRQFQFCFKVRLVETSNPDCTFEELKWKLVKNELYKRCIDMSHTHIGLDKDFTSFIEDNNFEMTIFTEFALPYYLLINSGFYTFEADENFILSENNKKRKVAFRIQSFFRDDQKVPLRESTFKIKPNNLNTDSYTYGVFHSIIQVVIQSFNSEKELINTTLKEKGSDFTTDINQAFLEYILFRYNETTDGRHAISPSVYDCSHLSFYYIYSNFLLANAIITTNLSNITQINDSNFRSSLNREVNVAEAFYGEAKYACKTYDFKKAIIYSAITLETYISNIIDKIPNNEKYGKDPNGNFRSIFSKTKMLIRAGHLTSKIEIKDLIDNMKNITEIRNDIMHGKLKNFELLKNKAIGSIESLDKVLTNLYE